MTNLARYSFGLLVGLALVGCSQQGPATTTVTGKITFPDGSPLPGGRIDFRSVANNTMVSGQIKSDGSYEAQVPLGDQKVSIENKHLEGVTAGPPGLAPMPGSDQRYVPIAPRYGNPDTSGLKTTVSGRTHTFNIPLE